MLRKVFCSSSLWIFVVLCAASQGICADPKVVLQDTVKRFYDAYLDSKWKTAEQYVDVESRDVFRSQPKPSVLKYQIKSIEFLKGGQEATVAVAVDQPVAPLGGKLLTLNLDLRWKSSKGKWYLVIGALPPSPVPTGPVAATRDVPTTDLHFDFTEFDFGSKRQGDLVEIEFPFVNTTDHPVRVAASLVTNCHCIEVGVNKETVAPGEKALVHFTLHSDPFTYYYHQGIGVKVEPGGGNAILDITGFFAPAADNPMPAVVKSSGAEK